MTKLDFKHLAQSLKSTNTQVLCKVLNHLGQPSGATDVTVFKEKSAWYEQISNIFCTALTE